jgi:PPOX class probable F420-dependent enzyme
MSRAQRDAFLKGRRIAVLVTTAPDGTPVPTPIWYVYRDGVFYFRSAGNAVKTRNIERDPRVSICVQDERAPYRSVVAYGEASVGDAQGGLEHEMPRRYLGMVGARAYESTREAIEQGPEVTIVVRPSRYVTADFRADTPIYGRAWLTLKRILPPWL